LIWSNFIIYPEIQDYLIRGKCILSDKYNNLDDELPFINKFIELMPTLKNLDEGYKQIGKINFIYISFNDLIFVTCADLNEDVLSIAQKSVKLIKDFYNKYKNKLGDFPSDLSIFEPFKSTITETFFKKEEETAKLEEVSNEELIQIKIGVVGLENAGKRSLVHLIFGRKADSMTLKKEPQVFMKKGRITQKYNAFVIAIPLKSLEDQIMLLKNSDLIFVVVDSKFQNVITTQNYLDKIQEIIDKSRIIIIANKQDQANTVKPDVISKMYTIPTIGFVANNQKYYTKIIDIIEKKLNK